MPLKEIGNSISKGTSSVVGVEQRRGNKETRDRVWSNNEVRRENIDAASVTPVREKNPQPEKILLAKFPGNSSQEGSSRIQGILEKSASRLCDGPSYRSSSAPHTVHPRAATGTSTQQQQHQSCLPRSHLPFFTVRCHITTSARGGRDFNFTIRHVFFEWNKTRHWVSLGSVCPRFATTCCYSKSSNIVVEALEGQNLPTAVDPQPQSLKNDALSRQTIYPLDSIGSMYKGSHDRSYSLINEFPDERQVSACKIETEFDFRLDVSSSCFDERIPKTEADSRWTIRNANDTECAIVNCRAATTTPLQSCVVQKHTVATPFLIFPYGGGSMLSFFSIQYSAHSNGGSFTIRPYQRTTLRLVTSSPRFATVSVTRNIASDAFFSQETTKYQASQYSKPDMVKKKPLLTAIQTFNLPSESMGSTKKIDLGQWACISPNEANYSWACDLCNVHGLKSSAYWLHCLSEEHSAAISLQPKPMDCPQPEPTIKESSTTMTCPPPTDVEKDQTRLKNPSRMLIESRPTTESHIANDFCVENGTERYIDLKEKDYVSGLDLATDSTHHLVISEVANALAFNCEEALSDFEKRSELQLCQIPEPLTESKVFTEDELKELVRVITRNENDDNWSCSLCNVTNLQTHIVKSHCIGKQHSIHLVKARHTEHISASVTQNENNSNWSCSLCGIANLQTHSIQGHCIGKKHMSLYDRQQGKCSPEKQAFNEGKLRNTDLLQYRIQLTELAQSDTRYSFLSMLNNTWACVLCSVKDLPIKDVEPHILGKKHASAIKAHEIIQQNEDFPSSKECTCQEK